MGLNVVDDSVMSHLFELLRRIKMIIYTFKVPKDEKGMNEMHLEDGIIITPDSHDHIESCHDFSEDMHDFFHCVDGVHANPPETWSRYGKSLDDIFRIINMEFIEVNTNLQLKKFEQCKTNLCHLACACAYMYNTITEMHKI